MGNVLTMPTRGATVSVSQAEPARNAAAHRPGQRRRTASVLAATTGGRAPRMDMLTITHHEESEAAITRITGPYADVLAYVADSPETVVRFDALNEGMAHAELAVP